jgi:hypothetical protein
MRKLGAACAGLIAAIASFLLAVVAAMELLKWWATASAAPNDASAGDSAGWAFLLLAPLWGPLAIASAVIAYYMVYRKLTRSRAAS